MTQPSKSATTAGQAKTMSQGGRLALWLVLLGLYVAASGVARRSGYLLLNDGSGLAVEKLITFNVLVVAVLVFAAFIVQAPRDLGWQRPQRPGRLLTAVVVTGTLLAVALALTASVWRTVPSVAYNVITLTLTAVVWSLLWGWGAWALPRTWSRVASVLVLAVVMVALALVVAVAQGVALSHISGQTWIHNTVVLGAGFVVVGLWYLAFRSLLGALVPALFDSLSLWSRHESATTTAIATALVVVAAVVALLALRISKDSGETSSVAQDVESLAPISDN